MNKKVNDSKNDSTENESLLFDPSKMTTRMLFVIAILVAAYSFFRQWYLLGYKPNKIKTKSRLAKAYGVSTITLMIWIEKFCPEDISKKYVGDRINNVRIGDIYPYLGMPIHNVSTSKKELAIRCLLSKSSLRRKLSQSADFEETIKLSLKEYNQMKFVPPIFFKRIIATYGLLHSEN